MALATVKRDAISVCSVSVDCPGQGGEGTKRAAGQLPGARRSREGKALLSGALLTTADLQNLRSNGKHNTTQ